MHHHRSLSRLGLAPLHVETMSTTAFASLTSFPFPLNVCAACAMYALHAQCMRCICTICAVCVIYALYVQCTRCACAIYAIYVMSSLYLRCMRYLYSAHFSDISSSWHLPPPPPCALENWEPPRGTENTRSFARSVALPQAINIFLSNSPSMSRDVML